jgi:hypothetical protein
MSELKQALDEWVAQRVPVVVVPGTVTAVRMAEEVCDVQPENGDALVTDVVLGNGIFPAEGAQVLIGRVENRPTDTFLISADTVTHFRLATEQESLHTLLKDLIAEVRALKFTTNAGPTIALITDLNWQVLATRVDNLLLP